MARPKTVLTPELKSQLKQGVKVRFKWWSNDTLVYTGRIEADGETLYFVPEHNYKGDQLLYEGMRYYNPLHTFEPFTQFEVLE